MAANYICMKQKTKVYGTMRLAMVVILGIWVEHRPHIDFIFSVSTRNHLRYNLTCYNSHLTPTGLSIRSNVRGPKAQFIIQKAERALVNERIR